MREQLSRFIQEYPEARKQSYKNNAFGSFVRTEIPKVFYASGCVNHEQYQVSGSVGKGAWATIPMIAILDKSITTTPQKGVYIVYLLSSDGKRLYLSFNQGCTDIKERNGKKETLRLLEKTANEIRKTISGQGFSTASDFELNDRATGNGIYYERGDIFHKVYYAEHIPDEETLLDDLTRMMKVYADYVKCLDDDGHFVPIERQDKEVSLDITTPKGETFVDVKSRIERIKAYISNRGFSYEDGLIENFFLSLKSKPFVILAGTSGTGKTRLVRLFAEAIGAEYELVPVRPDWSDSTDLFGHVDLNGRFIVGKILDFIWKAQNAPGKPFILCLDEMNLARVEYYLSDFLSIIETREVKDGRIESDRLVSDTTYGFDENARVKYGSIRFPENLYVVGTVNMDETTFPFSRKVLDRANTIEFNFVDLEPTWQDASENAEIIPMNNSILRSRYLRLKDCPTDEFDYVTGVCAELQSMNHILRMANAHVGYRVRDEIVFYLLNNREASLLSENAAMDNEILQKILPRIQGSSVSIKNMLCELFKEIAGDYEGYQTKSNNTADRMFEMLRKNNHIRYPKSAEKIAFMVRRFDEDGFTSYWL